MNKFVLKIFVFTALLSATIVPAQALDEKYVVAKQHGVSLYKQHNFAKALDTFNSIPALIRDDETSILISNIYMDFGKSVDAEKILIKMAEKKSQNSFVYYNLGIIEYNSNKFDMAEKYFKHATKLSKDFWPAYYNLGNSYFKQKNYNHALKAYQSGLKIVPDNTEMLYNIALTYKTLRKDQEAKKYLETYNMLLTK